MVNEGRAALSRKGARNAADAGLANGKNISWHCESDAEYLPNWWNAQNSNKRAIRKGRRGEHS